MKDQRMQLLLESPGLALGRKDGCFVLIQEQQKRKIAPTRVRSIVLGGKVQLSADAIRLAIDAQIPIVILHPRNQSVRGMLWSQHYGAQAALRRQQLAFGATPAAFRWVQGQLALRLEKAAWLLQQVAPEAPEAPDFILRQRNKILHDQASLLNAHIQDRWRGWEGSAMRQYFQTLGQALPEPWQFGQRSRRPARDGFNAMLNYVLGMLYHQLELALIETGLDPYLGLFHADESQQPVLVYDLIEGFRHWAEELTVRLFKAGEVDPSCFQTEKEEVLLHQRGKQLVLPAWEDYLNTPESQANGPAYLRRTALYHHCQHLAQLIRESL